MRRADSLHLANVLKSGSLNLLEPSGPVQACNGIAVPFPLRIADIRSVGSHGFPSLPATAHLLDTALISCTERSVEQVTYTIYRTQFMAGIDTLLSLWMHDFIDWEAD